MTRRDNSMNRCERCHMLLGLCVCAFIPTPKLKTRTRVVLFIHRYEDRKPTNTGRLATECLENSEVVVRGHELEPSTLFEAPEGSRAVLLFPHADAKPLFELDRDKPITLVVPDGSWRQASKVRKRVPGISELPCVNLPEEEASTYRLRREAHPDGLSTLEAIARALGVLEGPEARSAMEKVFVAMVERTLWARGRIGRTDAPGIIPEDIERHELLVRRPI